ESILCSETLNNGRVITCYCGNFRGDDRQTSPQDDAEWAGSSRRTAATGGDAIPARIRPAPARLAVAFVSMMRTVMAVSASHLPAAPPTERDRSSSARLP